MENNINPIGNETGEIKIIKVTKQQLKELLEKSRYEAFGATARASLKTMTHRAFLIRTLYGHRAIRAPETWYP